MKRLLMSTLAVLAIHAVGCGGAVEDEGAALAEPALGDQTAPLPIGGASKGTHVTYYSDASHTTTVGMREWGCSSATPLSNWGVTSAYSQTWTFICAVEPQ